MNEALKCALLSGLVLPGLGQVVLKRYKRGAVLMLAFISILSAIVIKAVQQAYALLEKIDSEGGTIDIDMIANVATQASTTAASHIIKILLWLLIFCWVIGVVDAYRIGRSKDIERR